MVETRQEVRAALTEITALTGWSMRELARKANISVATVSRLTSAQEGSLPYLTTRANIEKLLIRIRKKYAA